MNVLKHVDNHMDDLILDLQKLIQQPSVSAKNEGIEECAKLVKKLLSKNPHLIQKDVENITSLILEKITSTLENDGRIEIRGFGSLSVRKRKSKK